MHLVALAAVVLIQASSMEERFAHNRLLSERTLPQVALIDKGLPNLVTPFAPPKHKFSDAPRPHDGVLAEVEARIRRIMSPRLNQRLTSWRGVSDAYGMDYLVGVFGIGDKRVAWADADSQIVFLVDRAIPSTDVSPSDAEAAFVEAIKRATKFDADLSLYDFYSRSLDSNGHGGRFVSLSLKPIPPATSRSAEDNPYAVMEGWVTTDQVGVLLVSAMPPNYRSGSPSPGVKGLRRFDSG